MWCGVWGKPPEKTATETRRTANGFVWQKLHLPQENTKVLYGKSYTSLGKTQRFCMAKSTPPSGKHKGFVWQKLHLPQENTTVLYSKSYTSLRKTQRFCIAKATPPSGKHKGFA